MINRHYLRAVIIAGVITLLSVASYYYTTSWRFKTFLAREQYMQLPVGIGTWC